MQDLTESEKSALLANKSSESYKINAKLRDGGALTAQEQRFVELLESALEKLPRYHGTLYRNLTFADRSDLDTFVAEHPVDHATSASSNIDGYPVAGEHIIHLIFPESTGGRAVSGFGNNFESKVIYPRRAKFIPERVTYGADSALTIYLKEAIHYGAGDNGQLYSEERGGSVRTVQELHSGDVQLQGVPGRNSREIPGRGRTMRGQDFERGVPGREVIEHGAGQFHTEEHREGVQPL